MIKTDQPVLEALDEGVVSGSCPECGCTEIIRDPDAGERICGCCGLVLGRIEPDWGLDWRAYTPGEWEDRSRAATLARHGNATLIGRGRDAQGGYLDSETFLRMKRLQWRHHRVSVNAGRDRNLGIAYPELKRLTRGLHLSSVVYLEAERIYRQALDKGLVRGRGINEITAACVYAACRITGVSRSLATVCKHTSVLKRNVAQSYRLVHNELDLDVPLPDPRTRVYQIGDAVVASEKAKQHAVNILSAARRDKATAGKAPAGLAAAALWLACRLNGERVTQKVIADAAGVTEVTIRNRYKDLEEFTEEEP